jgi:SAM-dependent methyltransferase
VTSDAKRQRSLSFGAQAAAYERGRPSYPPEAVSWLLASDTGVPVRDVLDLGAGTGKLTSRLVERGLNVVAVDPLAELLEVLQTTLPDTPALLGTAEQIPLPDNSIDAVLVAQAWHWFDPDRAATEIARVLRPGGRLGLLWNVRDERLGWVKDFGRIIGPEHDWANKPIVVPEPFTDVHTHYVEWTNYITREALIDYVASRSYCIASPADVRTRTLDDVRQLLATHPALAGSQGIALPYVTVCARATLS